MSKRLNKHKTWEALFDRHNILLEIEQNGVCQISSKDINELHEARLVTKFDHRIQLPDVFKKHNLTIQPNTRGTYLIGKFESYQDVIDDPTIQIEGITFPSEIQTIDPANLYSESAVLLCAYYSGIISQVLGQNIYMTLFGRMSAGSFEYDIRNNQTRELHRIKVEGAQLEIDGGFEGDDVLAIFEAKNEIVNDFHVRQLYYPYRLWRGKTGKKVVPIFLSYSNSNSVFSIYEFRFGEDTKYNSIELVQQRKFQIVPSSIELDHILAALERVREKPEPQGIPFPQADSFERVVDLLAQLYGADGALTKDHITNNYAFDARQTLYYTRAASYLGLVERQESKSQGVTYSLTKRALSIMSKHPQARNLALVECILERKVFNRTLKLYFERAARPTIEEVEEIMKTARIRVSGTTISRRAQTVLAWIDWLVKLTRA